MILLDANLLLYAYNSGAKQHKESKKLLEDLLSSSQLVGLPWLVVWAFLRIATHTQIFSAPLTAEEACAAVSLWLQCPNVRLLSPGEQHWQYLQEQIHSGQARGPLVMDAVMAALAAEYGAEIWTADRDFLRFDTVRSRNPLSMN